MMMATIPKFLVASFIIFSLFHGNAYSNNHHGNDEKNVFIVYIGAKPHDDHDLIAQSHHDILTNILGSEEEAKKSLVYNYKYSFSGFAAELTKSQAKKIAEIPGVTKVMKDMHHSVPHNTRSWDYLDLSVHTPNNLLHKSNMGDGIIIGVLDSGIYPSRAFNDKDHGPIPSKWKGICKSEGKFNAAEMCNKKIIGARWFREGFVKEYQDTTFLDDPSPLDIANGHGTHVASTAAGSFVDNVTYYDVNVGTFRGGAPHAKLAMYKVLWKAKNNINGAELNSCADSDILGAIDQAIHDGVDILSISLGKVPHNLLPETDVVSAIGSFHALLKGIPVVFSAGNDGPGEMTILNSAPWAIDVAASSIDRSYYILVTLGNNNKTLVGEGMFGGKEIDFTSYVIVTPNILKSRKTKFEELIPDDGSLKGKVVVIMMDDAGVGAAVLVNLTACAGGVALIMAAPQNDVLDGEYSERISDKKSKIPLIKISYADASILIDSTSGDPKRDILKVSTTRIHLGNPIQTKVAKFSSRGPSIRVSSILKPDIAAPGVDILAAGNGGEDGEFTIMSGTSMAAPHVAGVLALLKKAHPDWSPAALKSAISTTAWNHDSRGFPVYATGPTLQLANPFDCGSGIINPNAANQPGLVYDTEATDYVHYLCALGYDNEKIYNMTRFGESGADNRFSVSNICPPGKLSIYDVNVPSITIADLRKSITLTRTVTNVGPVDSAYTAIIQAPFGTNITVEPKVLKFSSTTTKISYVVNISSTYESIFFNFGSLAWTDGKHYVRIPISVKTVFSP